MNQGLDAPGEAIRQAHSEPKEKYRPSNKKRQLKAGVFCLELGGFAFCLFLFLLTSVSFSRSRGIRIYFIGHFISILA